MKPVRLEEEASAEIADAASWYEQRQDGLGRRFLRAVDRTFEQITGLPQAGAPIPRVPPSLGVRRVPLKGFPDFIVYLETEASIRVLAVAHERRASWLLAIAHLNAIAGPLAVDPGTRRRRAA